MKVRSNFRRGEKRAHSNVQKQKTQNSKMHYQEDKMEGFYREEPRVAPLLLLVFAMNHHQ